MRFILRMALRELRSSWRRLAFFFICVAIGVGSIVALRSLIQNVRVALTAEARTLTAGDVYLRTDRPWTEAAVAAVRRRLEAQPGAARTDTVDTVTMVRLPDEASVRTKVVELRGVQDAFPFYGELELRSGRPYDPALLDDRGALVAPDLLAQLDLRVGERIAIGGAEFTIRDVIVSEPGRQLGAFAFGPRVLVAYDAVEATGLLSLGSRAEHQMLLRVPDESAIDPLVDGLRTDLEEEFVRVGSYRRTENRIERNLGRAENYLSLIGFVVVILGGIGVWSVTRVFVQQRLRSVAVLKCLGATTPRVLAIYVAQVALLGLGGATLGVAFAQVALFAVPASLAEEAAAAAGIGAVSTDLTPSAVVQGIGVGVLVSVLFALVPLLDVRHVKPLLLLRQGQVEPPPGVDWLRAGATAAVGAGLVAVAGWQAPSWGAGLYGGVGFIGGASVRLVVGRGVGGAVSLEVGLYVVVGFIGVAIVLHVIGRVLVSAVRPLAASRLFALRHAVLNLTRPGNQTRVVLLAVGLGSFFIIGVRAIQTNLLAGFALEMREDMPDMFLIDIQQDQADGVSALLEDAGAGSRGGAAQLIPVLRARVTGVEGEETSIEGRQEVRRAGFGREYTITYRPRLEDNERVIAGEFWDAEPSAVPEVSIEESLQERGIDVGDRVRFDVLGREIEARVTSVREVEWDDSRSGGFMFLFRPGTFDDAPHTFIAFLQGPAEEDARARLQRDIVAQFANVSVIDALAVIGTVRRVLGYVTRAITVVGGIALLAGVLILVGSVAMTKFQRMYEAAVFKTLGASSRALITMYVLEYGVLGTLAGLVGAVGAMGLTWAMSRQLLEVPWRTAPLVAVAGVGATALLVGVVGVVSSTDVLRRKPLATLRAE